MDEAELRVELERGHAACFGWVLACCAQNPTEAEEVLQTAYLKVLSGQARFDGRAAFRTWLFAVIRKTAAEARRRAWWQRLRWARFEEIAEPVAPRQQFGDALDQAELQKVFVEALAALPRRQREVLHLVFYQDLSLSEAAAAMGVSVGSARTHYERGKARLRQWLNESKVLHESGFGRKKSAGAVPKPEAGG